MTGMKEWEKEGLREGWGTRRRKGGKEVEQVDREWTEVG